MSVAITNTTPPLSEGGSQIFSSGSSYADQRGQGKAIVFSTPDDNDSQITSIELGLNKGDRLNDGSAQSYPQTYSISLSLWSVGSYGIPSQQITPTFTENVTLTEPRTIYTFTGFNPTLTSDSTYALLVSNSGLLDFKWGNTNVDLDTQPVGLNGFRYQTMWFYNPATGKSLRLGRNANTIVLNVNIGPSKGRYSLGPMPTGNVNEHTGIEIATSGYFSGRGTFTVLDPIQTGNNYVKPGEYGELVLDSQTGYYHYTPDFNKIAELKTGEVAIDEFTINLSATNGTISTGKYRVELVGYSDPDVANDEESTVLAPKSYRIADYMKTGKRTDPITGFRLGIDKLELDFSSLGFSSDYRIKNVNDSMAFKRVAVSDVDLIALHKNNKISLWWNQNGDEVGLGKGGLIAILAEDKAYGLGRSDFVNTPVFSQQNFV